MNEIVRRVSTRLSNHQDYDKRIPFGPNTVSRFDQIIKDALCESIAFICPTICPTIPAETTHVICNNADSHVKQGEYSVIDSSILQGHVYKFQFYAHVMENIFVKDIHQWAKFPCNEKDGYIIGTCWVKTCDCFAIDASKGPICDFVYYPERGGHHLILHIGVVLQDPDLLTMVSDYDIQSYIQGMRLADYHYVRQLDPTVEYRNDLAALVIERFLKKK